MGDSIDPHTKGLDTSPDNLTPTTSTLAKSISDFSTDVKEEDLENQTISPDRSKTSKPKLVLLLLGMFIGCFLGSLDISIIATALPRIASEFDAQSQMAWIATAYLLGYTALQPMYGRFSDIFGRKQMYLTASIIFFLSSAGCGAAPTMNALVVFRAFQGMGGSGLFCVAMIMIADLFEDIEQRTRYQSSMWLAFAVSSVTGPLIGGVFVEHLTWRWCFYINLPFGAISMLFVAYFYNIPFERTDLRQKLRRVDYLGVSLVVISVICLLLPLSWGGTTYAWDSPVIIVLFCAFALFTGLLIFAESKAKEAIIPLKLFLNRNVVIAVFVNCIMGVCFMGCTFYLPLYLQAVKGASTTGAGLRMMPSSIAIVTSTIISSFLLKKLKDYRIFIWLGSGVMTLGIGLFILLDSDTSLGEQIAFVIVMGLGQGLIFQNCMLACQECAGYELVAVATALCGFLNSVGSAIGVAICAAAYNNALSKNIAGLPADVQAMVKEFNVIEDINAISKLPDSDKTMVIEEFAKSFQFLFTILTPIMGIAFISSLFLYRREKVTKA